MIGQTLRHYRILEKLGAGGMGEVYLAEDTRLGRQVAIKVLLEAFAENPERLARFDREAKVLASLNHPHIGAIYGLEKNKGQTFLVLELIEGETLAERIGRGSVPVPEALELGRQIAEALEAAHALGVVHRDLKPANVKITLEGQLKVLDFGLAKVLAPELPEADLTHSPTLTQPMTRTGIILGTAAYMSPEQARGQEAGTQADIWAFGCVLYEMLTGERAFRGGTVSDLLAAILQSEPDWKALPEDTPPLTRSLLRRSLAKDTARRLHDMADARLELEESIQEPALALGMTVAMPARRKVLPRRVLLTLTSVALAAVLGLAAWFWTRPELSAPAARRFNLQPPSGVEIARSPAPAYLALSPDGNWVAFRGVFATPPLRPQLYLRSVEELEARPLPGTEGALNPFFSPDSQWLGFVANDRLQKVPVGGGELLPIYEVAGASFRGASWGEDGTILFNDGFNGLWRVSADGGEPEPVTTPDVDAGERNHRWPQHLPGGRAALFIVRTGYPESQNKIAVVSLDTGEYRTILTGGAYPRYVPRGYLVYCRLGTLYAVPFDLGRLEVTGDPRPVLEDVYFYYSSGSVAFAVSDSGSLVYEPGAPRVTDTELV